MLYLPRPYLSHTQERLWRRSPDEYVAHYLYGKEGFSSEYTAFGKIIHEALESGKSNDPITSMLIAALPKYPRRESKAEMKVEISVGKDKLVLYAKPDGVDIRKNELGDIKTGLPGTWTQAKADKDEQLLFYHLVYFLKTGRMLKKVRLHHVETRWEYDGENTQISLTGNVFTYEVIHSRMDLLKKKIALKKVAKEISQRVKEEIK